MSISEASALKRIFVCFAILLLAVLPALVCMLRPTVQKALKRLSDAQTADRILAYCEGYDVSRTGGSAVYYTGKDKDYALAAERLVKTYMPLLAQDFGLISAPFATVIIFPAKEDMYAAIGYAPPAYNDAAEPMGAYTAGIVAVLSPSCWADEGRATLIDTFISDGPVLHELAHFVLDVKVCGNYPEWFSEGCALYYENRYTGKDNLARLPAGTASYGELSGGFKYLNERESYRKSHEIIKFIAAARGERSLRYIYERLEEGKRLDHTLKKLLGDGIREFDTL